MEAAMAAYGIALCFGGGFAKKPNIVIIGNIWCVGALVIHLLRP